MNDVVYHRNKVWYGESTTIIIESGAGIVKVSFDRGEPFCAYIHDISVLETHRGCGLGRRLLSLAEEEAVRHKEVKSIKINVEKGNFAYDWYVRNGYSKYGKSGTLLSLKKDVKQ